MCLSNFNQGDVARLLTHIGCFSVVSSHTKTKSKIKQKMANQTTIEHVNVNWCCGLVYETNTVSFSSFLRQIFLVGIRKMATLHLEHDALLSEKGILICHIFHNICSYIGFERLSRS
jgi:hypothetical protein